MSIAALLAAHHAHHVVEEVLDVPFVGVAWNKTTDVFTRTGAAAGKSRAFFDGISPWKDMRLCNLANDGTVNAYYGDPGYVEDGSNGQVVVEIPSTQYKFIVTAEGYEWRVPLVPSGRYKVHASHARNGQVRKAIYVGAYEGCNYDVSAGAYHLADEAGVDFTVGTGDRLSSIAGAKPISGVGKTLNIANARRLANNRGPGWQLFDFQTASLLQLLFLIEYASFDTQGQIGAGITAITDDAATNMGMPTGATAALGNASGASVGVTHYATGQAANSVRFRGIENLWGNLWQFVDGINVKADRNPWIADHGQQSDLFAPPYMDSGYVLPNANGYISDIQSSNPSLDYAFLPSAVGASSTTKLRDYYYQNTGNRMALLGGGWSNGVSAGLWYWALYDAASTVNRTVGARLLYVGGD